MVSFNRLFCKPSLATLFVFAVIIKLVLIGSLIGVGEKGWAERFEQPTSYDDTEYYNIAQGLATFHVISYPDKARQPAAQIYRTPLYPAFLSGLGIISNWQPLAMLILQAAIFSLIPVIFCLVLCQAGCSPGFSWLLVFDPITNLLSITFMTEGLLVLFLLGGVYYLTDAEKPMSRLLALCLFGLAILVKPSVQFFYAALCLYLLIRYRPRLTTSALILISMVPLLAWMGRNYYEAGLFVISTQKNAAIMAVETIKAKQMGVADADLVKFISSKWSREHQGDDLYRRIMSNRNEFGGVTVDYIRNHPFVFAKYHVLGMTRLLMGTARNHIRITLPNCGTWSTHVWTLFNVVMVTYYSLLYVAILATFRFRSLKSELAFISWGIVFYNVALIGVLAYTTGGGLKRAPFIPFLIIVLALQMKGFQKTVEKDVDLTRTCRC